MKDDLLRAALGYAERGLPVIALHTPTKDGCSCQRGADCSATGKHPRTENGVSDATTDQGKIRGWWAQWPDANIGIATGTKSGLLVVDVDNKGGKRGSDNLAALAAELGELPTTLTATTGSGEHLYFEHPGVPVKNSRSQLADGVDVKTEGGYVVVAPSLHANGKRYAWKNPGQPPADLPGRLLARMTAQKGEKKEVQNDEHNVFTDAEVVHEGERNDTVYKLGCALRGQQGMEGEEIAAILLEYNSSKCDPPLVESEVMVIVDSVCKHPAEFAANKSGKRLEQNPLYWFPFNIREWFSDEKVMLMNDAQTGWHIRLKAIAWKNGGFIPADRNELWQLAKAKSKKAFEKDCKRVLSEYVEVEVGGELKLKHPQMAVQFADTLETWMQKKEAGEASKAAKAARLAQEQAMTGHHAAGVN